MSTAVELTVQAISAVVQTLCVYNRRDTTDAEISVESGRRRIMNCLTMEL